MKENGEKASNFVRLRNLVTKVYGCDMDSKREGHGLLEKYVQLKPKEAIEGTATRGCKMSGNTSELSISVDDEGYCSTICITTSCEFNSENPG